MRRVYIAGAHSRGQTFGHYLKYLNPEIEIKAYLYDNDEKNPLEINGVPVVRIDEEIIEKDCPVYLATRGVNQAHLIESLEKKGIYNIIPVDVKFDCDIRNRYLRKYFQAENEVFTKIDELNLSEEDIELRGVVYVASSAYDKALEEPYDLAEYEKRIQVGAALTDQRLENAAYDDIGDNISEKNRQYCELTGLYWIWKHATEDYVGLCHYRRHFILPDHWVERMEQNSIDVILPVPLYVAPNLEDNFRGRHAAREWDCMMQYLQSKLPEDYERAREFFQGNLYSPCNMLIARRQVLDELCKWLFPILDAVVKECGTEEDKYENRYPGFLSERLITYYFESKRQQYKIAYADKNFLK